MYVFTVLFVALPILYMFLLSFLQRAQVWGVDFTFTLDNYKRILEPLYLNTFLHSKEQDEQNLLLWTGSVDPIRSRV